MLNKENRIANALQIIAWVTFIGGGIAGFAFGTVENEYGREIFSFSLALIYWAGTIISGVVFLGFAEIIKLLQELVNNRGLSGDLVVSDEIANITEQYNDLPGL